MASGDPGDSRFWQAFGEAAGRAAREGPHAVVPDHECLEWCPVCRGADVLRATTTPELRQQWQGIQRDALVAIRALLDAYIERLEGQGRGRGVEVEDIPIE